MKKIIEYFPDKLQNILDSKISKSQIEEIRIRNQKPIILKFNNQEEVINYNATSEDILTILQLICENSIYSYQKQISSGFITLQGGHRVGIVGSCVIENNKVININYINSFNFRIARQVIGCSNKIMKFILDFKNNNIYNTLIISPPGAGKTTLLRDIARQVSNENRITVGIVDERSEIASLYKGVPQNDVGIRTDVIENISKSQGMRILVRSMSPQVIIADEIGIVEDMDAINYALCSGCKGIFTAHGSDLKDIYLNPILKNLLDTNIFERLIFLDKSKKGEVKEIYELNKENFKYEKCEI